jgi:hypothetical protein
MHHMYYVQRWRWSCKFKNRRIDVNYVSNSGENFGLIVVCYVSMIQCPL